VTRIGEKLTYIVKWKGVPAGTAELEVKRQASVRDRPVYVVELRSESNDFLSLLYDVKSSVKSFVDAETGQSYLFKRNGREGPRQLNDQIEFDYESKAADGSVLPVSIYTKIKKEKPQANAPRPIPGTLQDSLSVIYYLRHLDLSEVGQTHQVLLGGRKQTDIASVTVLGFDRIALPKLGAFDCVKVEPKGDPQQAARANIVVVKGTAVFWLEKNTHIPLMVTVDIPVGSITLSLIRAEGTDLLDHTVGAGEK
jgi:hypothetical protein